MDRMAGRVIESFLLTIAPFIPMCRDEIYWFFTEVCQRNSPKLLRQQSFQISARA